MTKHEIPKADEVNQNQPAQQASSNVLRPIYKLAEYMSFSAFYWLAFAIMVTGVVSFALQLVLAKLVVLAKSSLSLTEVLSDSLGLVISLIGLVLTTQAATENSHFTESSRLQCCPPPRWGPSPGWSSIGGVSDRKWTR